MSAGERTNFGLRSVRAKASMDWGAKLVLGTELGYVGWRREWRRRPSQEKLKRWTAGLTTTTVVDGGAKVHDAMLEISCAKTQSAGRGRSMRIKAQLYISGERSTKLSPELQGASVSAIGGAIDWCCMPDFGCIACIARSLVSVWSLR